MRAITCLVNVSGYWVIIICIYLLPFYFDILFIHERLTERERHGQREKQAPRREPDAGLDPGSPGSRLGLKVVLSR